MRKQSGVTLFELMMVIAMIAILSAAFIPNYVRWIQTAGVRDAISHTDSILKDMQVRAIRKASFVKVTFNEADNSYSFEEETCDGVGWSRHVDIEEKFGAGVKLRIDTAHDDPATVTYSPNGGLTTVDTIRVAIENEKQTISSLLTITSMGQVIRESN